MALPEGRPPICLWLDQPSPEIGMLCRAPI
jgi:hypothetical protein